ncbi:UDP-N-acetylmuramoyl-tripeptide--D-alanyl-D-alanine ligase [Subtercola sp. PAMC28395]|uniref:UDP-N-acetylmuramoyl-tripeptide--D-alanyl-D- alanine ligase n=1 Tax=Subtercola sp. PAMC28395 TaxID=2846775 RepID=UPI001C0D6A2D|nr:UDP-N-acetylmuramoyl-tripeptide--D-alanyl-D-alanine ligase [Subtercola sp. PAMC28395]QWT23170.1 UDP-N-acetylmuramoyl-tripeptide--D-alanyl-D-alanine ligase [Subtercola sp. PAMC28395]
MIDLTLGEVTRIVGGTLVLGDHAVQLGTSESTIVNGPVDTDSREIVPGGIFVAKPGEFSDGHLYVPAAVENGADLVVVERVLDDLAIPQIVVSNSVDALGMLATEVVRRIREAGTLKVIGITGSNGKTTTKNLVRTILEGRGPTVAPRDSFNNEVGAPLTMLKLESDTRYLVAEMGASKPGEITRLVRMARPDIGVVLMVGLAHAGEFGGIEKTLQTKTEMVTDLLPTDVAVLNFDDYRVVGMAEKTRASILWFGLDPRADVRASSLVATPTGTDFTLTLPTGESARVHFGVLGEHHVTNALAATAVAHTLEVPLAEIVKALETVTRAERWRMEVLHGTQGVTIINDAYNASPDSMLAGLKTLAQISGPGIRRVAILGEMSELGEFSLEEHDRIGRTIVRLGIERIFVVGDGALALHLAATQEGSWDGESVFFATADEAYAVLEAELRSGDVVLVKSSNSAGLRFLGDRLGERFA